MTDSTSERRELPEWVGTFASGRGDLAERCEEILRDAVKCPDEKLPSQPSGGVGGNS